MENPNARHACGHPMIPEIDDMKKNLRSCKSCQQRYDVAFDVLVKDIFDPKKLTAEDTEMLDVAYKFPMISGGLQTGDDEDREGDVVDGDGVDSAIPFSAEQPPHLRLSKACLRRRPLKESCLDLIKYLNRKCNCIISKISESIKPLDDEILYAQLRRTSIESCVPREPDHSSSELGTVVRPEFT